MHLKNIALAQMYLAFTQRILFKSKNIVPIFSVINQKLAIPACNKNTFPYKVVSLYDFP